MSRVTATSLNQYDWSIVDESGVSCLIDDDMTTDATYAFLDSIQQKQGIEFVTGIFNYSFGTYKIQVRDMGDFGEVGIESR